jgi:hypothetical protein
MIQNDRKERTERERREHVAHISAWHIQSNQREDGIFPIRLVNTSGEPVYNVVVFPVFIQGAAAHTDEEWVRCNSMREYEWYLPFVVLGALLPGSWDVNIRDFDTGILSGRPGVEVACTDRFGASWIRRATGQLRSIPTNAIDYYYGLARLLHFDVSLARVDGRDRDGESAGLRRAVLILSGDGWSIGGS